ncbi:GIY-YIG nuclease family protein [Trichothermofontia sp.]
MVDVRQQAKAILDQLAFMPFEQCLAIDRQFNHLPTRPGIYAIRHQTEGVLYLGKTNDLGTRFNGGHKAFTWAWLDRYPPTEVRIAIVVLERWGNPALLSELEQMLLRSTEPPYNVKIPREF